MGSVGLVDNKLPVCIQFSVGWGMNVCTHDSLRPYHDKNLAASSMSRSDHGCTDMPCHALASIVNYSMSPYRLFTSSVYIHP